MFLLEVINQLEKKKVKYAVVGGYALALHGIVRATMDIDLVLQLQESEFTKAEKALNEIGLQSRIPVRAFEVIKMRQEFIEKKNLLAWSFVDYKDPTRQVDILIHKDLKDLQIQKIAVRGSKISVVSLEQLLEMKKESGRPQDLVDIQNIKDHLNAQKS